MEDIVIWLFLGLFIYYIIVIAAVVIERLFIDGGMIDRMKAWWYG